MTNDNISIKTFMFNFLTIKLLDLLLNNIFKNCMYNVYNISYTK